MGVPTYDLENDREAKMRKIVLLVSAVLVGSAMGSVAASAQDYLGIHLETQREENLRRHQQGQAAAPRQSSKKYVAPISGAARHAAMRRHHREYGEVMKEKGFKAADQWLAEQVAAGR